MGVVVEDGYIVWYSPFAHCALDWFIILYFVDWSWTWERWVFHEWQKEISKEMAREAGEAIWESWRKQKKERGCICSSKGQNIVVILLLLQSWLKHALLFVAGEHGRSIWIWQECQWQQWHSRYSKVIKGNLLLSCALLLQWLHR